MTPTPWVSIYRLIFIMSATVVHDSNLLSNSNLRSMYRSLKNLISIRRLFLLVFLVVDAANG